jgi:MraZ protein
VAKLVGRYEHSLDAKGRVILPAKFRGTFSQGGYLTPYHDGCLALWTHGEFERQMDELQAVAQESPQQRNRARLMAKNSFEIEVDRQGRMAIPGTLRDFAGLESDVLVQGALDRVELWDPGRWQERVEVPEKDWMP